MWTLKLTSEQAGPCFWIAVATEQAERAKRVINLLSESMLTVSKSVGLVYEKKIVGVEG